jgi:predicted nucleic-acid-binding protein
MIGVDTNVLLRFALQDDAKQSRAALAFLEDVVRAEEPAMISPVALVEFVWTLMRRYRFVKDDVIELLDALAESGRVVYSDDALISSCVDQWRHGEADLPDYLIAALNLQAGARTTLTFDKRAALEPGFTLLQS